MNRIPKFRSWDGKRFSYNFWLYNDDTDGLDLYDDKGELAPEPCKNKFVLQQFTGLKDKNNTGKEVYEGDIFEHDDGMVKVIWDYRMGGWAVEFNDENMIGLWEVIDRIVLGNIYENPELIK